MPGFYEWSDGMDRLFGELIVKAVQDDPRTDWSEDRSLGYPFDVIRKQVLAKGLADFAVGHAHGEYGALSAAEKCLLYGFVNMKKHFFACRATIEAYRPEVEALFIPGQHAVILDFGCGPATACLALADLLPGRTFDYIGIDAAPPMRALAHRLWEAARAAGLIHRASVSSFFGAWEAVDPDQIEAAAAVLIIFSYFFASRLLDLPRIDSISRFIRALVTGHPEQLLLLMYLNSPVALANRNYELFKWQLGVRPALAPSRDNTIEYRKKPGGAVAGKETFVREVLAWQGQWLCFDR
jgi:SAM-dependent methyltransferase